MAEKTFLELGDVTVTTTRFIVKGKTYAVSGITSVTIFRHDPSRLGPILGVILGLFLFLAGVGNYGAMMAIIGLVLTFAACISWITTAPVFGVRLNTASGEVTALSNSSRAFIQMVLDALNDAIVERG